MDEDQEKVEEADRRAEKAKASLRSRFHELERRYEETKDRFDVGARIAEHPRAAFGIALGAGLLLGFLRGKSAPATGDQRTLGSTVIAALGALAIQALKDAALSEGRELATKWWADRTERDADPLEPILEH